MRGSLCVIIFFFSSRRRHTRCSRDWSSDVCSSDLVLLHDAQQISAEDFADIFVLVTFAHQSLGDFWELGTKITEALMRKGYKDEDIRKILGDFWELGTIFHSVGHRCAEKIGAQTD